MITYSANTDYVKSNAFSTYGLIWYTTKSHPFPRFFYHPNERQLNYPISCAPKLKQLAFSEQKKMCVTSIPQLLKSVYESLSIVGNQTSAVLVLCIKEWLGLFNIQR